MASAPRVSQGLHPYDTMESSTALSAPLGISLLARWFRSNGQLTAWRVLDTASCQIASFLWMLHNTTWHRPRQENVYASASSGEGIASMSRSQIHKEHLLSPAKFWPG
jgi:hypothetical protein